MTNTEPKPLTGLHLELAEAAGYPDPLELTEECLLDYGRAVFFGVEARPLYSDERRKNPCSNKLVEIFKTVRAFIEDQKANGNKPFSVHLTPELAAEAFKYGSFVGNAYGREACQTDCLCQYGTFVVYGNSTNCRYVVHSCVDVKTGVKWDET
jgi:hypothetical protein